MIGHDELKRIFAEAIELPPEAQAAYLDQACGGRGDLRAEVTALLAAAASRSFAGDLRPVGPCAGNRIGPYLLREELGEGGFGTVWLADQDAPLQRSVALKVLKPGMDTRQVCARFEVERQALAQMDHPHIARVFDGGATPEGRPYFVMELVRGAPLTTHCDHAALTVRERVELFVPVCHAVQHAHQKGVIHRDLKPHNVLVAVHDGVAVPKVIDFGIAKAAGAGARTPPLATTEHQVLGTPEYMAPEQAEGARDVDTRTDIYALGVILHELLVGVRPFAADNIGELLRSLRETDPARPSTRITTLGDRLPDVVRQRRTTPGSLGRQLRGDLDWILLRALERDRDRRYATATALAEDLERFLRCEPVQAGPPGRLYRWRRHLQRHRTAVVITAVVVLALVVAGLGQLAAFQREILRAQEARKASTTLAVLERVLRAPDPHEVKGPDYTVRELLDELDRTIVVTTRAGDREVQAMARTLLGRSFLGLGLPDRAAPHVQAALELAQARQATAPEALAEARLDQAQLLHDLGRHAEALDIVRSVVAASGPQTGPHRTGLGLLVDLLRHEERFADAVVAARTAVARFMEQSPVDQANLARAHNNLGLCLTDTRDFAGAEAAFRAALVARSLVPDQMPLDTADHTCGLAIALIGQGRVDEAATRLDAALPVFEHAFGSRGAGLVSALRAVALLQRVRGDRNAAIATCRRILDQIHPGPAERLSALDDLVHVLIEVRDLAQAEPVARAGFELTESMPSLGTAAHLRSACNLGSVLTGLGRWRDAAAVLRPALDQARAAYPGSHPRPAELELRLAQLYVGAQRLDQAEPLLRSAIRAWQELGNVSMQADALEELAQVLLARDRSSEAETRLGEALSLKRQLPEAASTYVRTGLQLVKAMRRNGRAPAADALVEELAHWSQARGSADRDGRRLLFVEQVAACKRRGDLLSAARQTREFAELQAREFPEETLARAGALARLMEILLDLGQVEEAMAAGAAAITAARTPGSNPARYQVEALALVASLAERANRREQALELTREALTTAQRLHGTDSPVALALADVLAGRLAWAAGAADATMATLEAALRRQEQERSITAADAMIELARELVRRGQGSAAVPLAQSALILCKELAGPDSQEAARAHLACGQALTACGEGPAAVPHHRAAVAILRGTSDRPALAQAHLALGEALGEAPEAIPPFREALEILVAILPPSASLAATVRGLLRSPASPAVKAPLLDWLQQVGTQTPAVGVVLAAELLAAGQADTAEPLLQHLVPELATTGTEHLRAQVLTGLGQCALTRNDAVAAEQALRPAVDLLERLQRGSTRHLVALSFLAQCVAARGQFAAAAPLMDLACDALQLLPERTGEWLAAARRRVHLHQDWDRREPGQGHDTHAAQLQHAVEQAASRRAR